MSLQSTLDELKTLAKNKQIRKESPHFYKLVKEGIEIVDELIRLEAMLQRTRTRYEAFITEFNEELKQWQTQN